MPKLKINRTDAPKPDVGPDGLLHLRSPLAMTVPPGATVVMDLGVTADRALLLFPANEKLVFPLQVAPPGGLIRLEFRNPHKFVQLVEVGDAIVKASVLDNSKIYVES